METKNNNKIHYKYLVVYPISDDEVAIEKFVNKEALEDFLVINNDIPELIDRANANYTDVSDMLHIFEAAGGGGFPYFKEVKFSVVIALD